MGLLQLFWVFLKINCLTLSGPSSMAFIREETVGKLVSEEQFLRACALSGGLPGSDAIQMALFIGYASHGVLGALVALAAAIIPPAVGFALVAYILELLGKVDWLDWFFRGLTPAVIGLIVYVGTDLFWKDRSKGNAAFLVLVVVGFVGMKLKFPAPIVLVAAGFAGVLLRGRV